MEHEPDYQSCSLRDLLDAERRINREDYPERYARLCAEIDTRRRQGDAGAAERLKPESGRVARLKVRATLRQTFVEVKQNWRPLTKALLAPAAAMSIVDFVDAEIGDEGLISGLLATLSGAIYVVYAVSCHRVILIGQGSLPNSWGIYFTRRELRFAGWSIAIIVLLIPLVMANGFVAVPMLLLLPDLPTETFVHAVWLLFLPMMYVASRLSLVLPATAVDKATSIAQAWHSSRGNGWLSRPLSLCRRSSFPPLAGYGRMPSGRPKVRHPRSLFQSGYVFSEP